LKKHSRKTEIESSIKLGDEDKAGLYITAIVHLAVIIVLLLTGLGLTSKNENSFVLDFSKIEQKEKMLEEIQKLEKEAELKHAISRKLQEEIGKGQNIRNIAVNRSDLKDDRGTDADKLYKDAERLQKELKSGYSTETYKEKEEEPLIDNKSENSDKFQNKYKGPTVLSYSLEGRKASRLPIPAYRCMEKGEVTVLITVDNSGTVTSVKIDEESSSKDGCLRAYATRAARLSKFSANPKAPAKQSGSIIYSFIEQ